MKKIGTYRNYRTHALKDNGHRPLCGTTIYGDISDRSNEKLTCRKCRKILNSRAEPLMKRGLWLSLLQEAIKDEKGENCIERYVVGIFPTAHEAFNKAIELSTKLDRHPSDLVLVRLEMGQTVEALVEMENYFVFPDCDGMYFDIWGLFRGSYVMRRQGGE